jgi:hypothetical protein
MKVFIAALYIIQLPTIAAFSAGSNQNQPTFTLSDRFKATCPADISTILQFDPNLVLAKDDDNENNKQKQDEQDQGTWVAIYRSSNNLPSVLVKDNFLNAMRIATSVQTDGESSTTSTAMDSSSLSSKIETSDSPQPNSDASLGINVKARTPVAVARIRPSRDFENIWVIEHMRCSLRKEDTNEACDGNSEHAEAISVCIDELLLHHLQEGREFDGIIRTKATLHQGRLLEDRGFEEVQMLSKDMATHLSSLDGSLIKYSERALASLSKSPGARDRALKLLHYLGKLDPKDEDEVNADDDANSGEDDYDPWANVAIF